MLPKQISTVAFVLMAVTRTNLTSWDNWVFQDQSLDPILQQRETRVCYSQDLCH